MSVLYIVLCRVETSVVASLQITVSLLPTGSEEKGVFGVGSIPVAILPSCQDVEIIAL